MENVISEGLIPVEVYFADHSLAALTSFANVVSLQSLVQAVF